MYEQLVTHSRHQLLLVHEPFLRPLLKILASSQDEIFPTDVEKRLVILLNQLCVVLMQNVHLLDLFFFSSSQQQGNVTTKFVSILQLYAVDELYSGACIQILEWACSTVQLTDTKLIGIY